MNRREAISLIQQHEGLRLTVYADTAGIPTIGYGFNLKKAGARDRITAVSANYDSIFTGHSALTEAQAKALFEVDFNDATTEAKALVSNFDKLPDRVQGVIVDMVFNLGGAGFAKFKRTIAAFERFDYCTAAAQMADSAWSNQVPNRAREDISIVMEYCHV